jgi:hypothetical protein
MGGSSGLCEISLNGAHLGVLVVASSSADAKSIAGAVDTWRSSAGLPGDVEYSQQAYTASTHYVVNTGSFGRKHSEMSVNIPPLVSSIKQVLPGCNFALAVPISSTLKGMPSATKFSDDGAIAYWDVTDGGVPVTAYTTLPVGIVFALVCWALLPVCIAFGAGAIIVRNRNLQLRRGREICGSILLGTVGTAMFAPSIVMVVRPRVLDPILWLWLGSNSGPMSFAALMSTLIAGVLAAVFVATRVEYRYELGEVEEAKARLTQRVASVAVRMGMMAPRVKLRTTLLFAGRIATRGGCIHASFDRVKSLSDLELDSILAHELASMKLGFGRWRNWPVTAALVQLVLLLGIIGAPNSYFHVGKMFIYPCILLGAIGVFVLNRISSVRGPRERLEAHQLAAQALKVP